MVSLELQGWWWAPEQPDNPVPGNLTFAEDNGLKLSLMGSLSKEEYPSESSPLGEPLPIILGVVSGKEATLVDATPRRRHFSIPGFNAVEYRVGTAYLGQHYGTVADLAFDKVTLQFTHLEDWLAQVPIYRRYPPSEEWPKRHEVGFVQEEPISGAIRNGSVMLGHDVNVSERASSATIQGTASMRIELAERLTANQWYRGYIQPIENLLSLAVGRSVHTTKLLVHTMNQKPRRSVEVVARPFVGERSADSLLREDSMLFTSKDIECGFGEMLARWLAVHDEYRDILNLYFSIGRSSRMYLEHQFLSTVQALEGYQRRRFPGTELPDEEHAQRIEAILNTAPNQHRKWLEQKLAYSNELSLKRRLNCLTRFVGEPLVPWMPNAKKRDSFVKKVVDARNVLTHYSPHHPQKALASDTLFGMTEALSVMMQALLLREIGFSETEVMKLFENYQTYGWAARRARDGI